MTQKQKYRRNYFQKHRKKSYAQTKAWCKKNPKKRLAICQRWDKKNKERRREWAKARHKKNPERRRASARRWYKKNSQKVKSSRLKNSYGITIQEFSIIRKAQKNRCAICHKPFHKIPYVDHDHKTKVVRGLLCMPCNCALGLFQDSIFNFKQAIKYLRRVNE